MVSHSVYFLFGLFLPVLLFSSLLHLLLFSSLLYSIFFYPLYPLYHLYHLLYFLPRPQHHILYPDSNLTCRSAQNNRAANQLPSL